VGEGAALPPPSPALGVQAPRQICTSDGVQAATSGPAAYLAAADRSPGMGPPERWLRRR